LQGSDDPKQQVEIELQKTDKPSQKLDKVIDQTPVYKSVGSLLIKSDRQTLLTELKERKELLGTRVTVLVGKKREPKRESRSFKRAAGKARPNKLDPTEKIIL